jgi:predicted nucleic acid-binding protein
VYAFDESVVFHESAKKVLESDLELCITQQTLYEFYRVTTSKPFQKRISITDVISATEFFRSNLTILHPTNHTDFILNDLIKEYKPVSGRIWDMLIFAQTIENNINILYTKNTRDYPKNPEIQIIDPTL